MDFRIVRKGYDTKETDDYILKITKEYEEELSKQKALILTLKDKLIALSDKVKEMESQKRMVASALVKAVEKAEESDYNYNRQHTKKVTQIDLTTDYMLNTTGTAKKVEVQTSTQHASTVLQVVLCIFAIIIEPFYFAYLILEILSQ